MLNRQSQAAAISIHTSREGGDSVRHNDGGEMTEFQSTPPAREVTRYERHFAGTGKFQSTPPAREVTDIAGGPWDWVGDFNPHLPRGR